MNKLLNLEIGKHKSLPVILLIGEFILNKLSNDEIMERIKVIESHDSDIKITQNDINSLRKLVSNYLSLTSYPKCKDLCSNIKNCRVDRKIKVTKREYSLIVGLALAFRAISRCASEHMNYIESLIGDADLLECSGESVGVEEMCLGDMGDIFPQKNMSFFYKDYTKN